MVSKVAFDGRNPGRSAAQFVDANPFTVTTSDRLDNGSLQSSPCLQGERVAFTGTLASMTHAEAANVVVEHGGVATEHVSRQTTMLVVGDEGWPLEDNGQPSLKLQQAERLREAGQPLEVLSESQWLMLLGLNEHHAEVHQLYTPAMLSSILKLPTSVIRSWARAGLIRPVRMVHRLPYFDFREVSSARRLSELLEAGAPRKEIENSLKRLPSVQRGDERPLEQLQILVHRLGVVLRDEHGLRLPGSGQRLLNFDQIDASEEIVMADAPSIRFQPAATASDDSPKDWLIEGCRLYDADRVAEALSAFRLAALSSPRSADVHFQLGECLYRLGHTEGALERYYCAVEHDHDFLEAWTQIGCLHRELGDLLKAKDAFLQALNLLPDYPDAHFHLAETLAEGGDVELARVHWEEYLQHDSRGPWAEVARQRLEGAVNDDDDGEE